jgi:hypothetical protein
MRAAEPQRALDATTVLIASRGASRIGGDALLRQNLRPPRSPSRAPYEGVQSTVDLAAHRDESSLNELDLDDDAA